MRSILWGILIFLIGIAVVGTFYFNSRQNLYLSTQNLDQNPPQPSQTSSSDSIFNSPIGIKYLRSLKVPEGEFTIHEKLLDTFNYERYLVSFQSEGYKIYALMTVPKTEMPVGGFPAIIFNHGYIPPTQYQTLERYTAYVDYLARNGFVVLKIDMRGHGKSEGVATGTYFSNAYNLDVLSALQALKNEKRVNSERIGLWGHSMSGNLVLRSLLISEEFKAGVIWAGAVYSYQDFAKYGISDSSFVRRPAMSKEVLESPNREKSPEVSKIRENPSEINFESEFWREISLTKNLEYLKAPIQIHHAINDETVNIGYSRDLSRELEKSGKIFEFYEYPGGGHNINSPYFEQAMQRTVEFFRNNLKTE